MKPTTHRLFFLAGVAGVVALDVLSLSSLRRCDTPPVLDPPRLNASAVRVERGLSGSECAPPPVLVKPVLSDYPPAACLAGGGEVRVRLVVDPAGEVLAVERIEATDPRLVGPALLALQRWRYEPRGGVSPPSTLCVVAVTVGFGTQ